jgi:hypothetical protein
VDVKLPDRFRTGLPDLRDDLEEALAAGRVTELVPLRPASYTPTLGQDAQLQRWRLDKAIENIQRRSAGV